MRRVIRVALWVVLILVTGLAIVVRLRYGGGAPYPDLTGEPLLGENDLETVLSYPEPIGNVAVSDDGRGFFTVHPESRPEGAKLLEFRDGAARPYPSEALQDELFQTPLGVVVDRQQRLWIIDHGKHGFGNPRLVAIDLLTDKVVHNHRFKNTVAPGGSFLQDHRCSRHRHRQRPTGARRPLIGFRPELDHHHTREEDDLLRRLGGDEARHRRHCSDA
jgi:hypothetical protein